MYYSPKNRGRPTQLPGFDAVIEEGRRREAQARQAMRMIGSETCVLGMPIRLLPQLQEIRGALRMAQLEVCYKALLRGGRHE